MAKIVKHPTLEGVTNETHPNLYDEATKTWHTPETLPKAFYPNGNPRKYLTPEQRKEMLANAGPRRTDEESLVFWKDKLVAAQARHKKEIEGIEKKITYFSTPRSNRNAVDPAAAEAAFKALTAQGLTPEQIGQFAEQARLAAAVIKTKTPEELAALAGPAPAFFNATPQPAPVG